MPRPLRFDLKARRPQAYPLLHQRLEPSGVWMTLGAYQNLKGLPWGQLDEKARGKVEAEFRLVREGQEGRSLAEWRGGKRVGERKAGVR